MEHLIKTKNFIKVVMENTLTTVFWDSFLCHILSQAAWGHSPFWSRIAYVKKKKLKTNSSQMLKGVPMVSHQVQVL